MKSPLILEKAIIDILLKIILRGRFHKFQSKVAVAVRAMNAVFYITLPLPYVIYVEV